MQRRPCNGLACGFAIDALSRRAMTHISAGKVCSSDSPTLPSRMRETYASVCVSRLESG